MNIHRIARHLVLFSAAILIAGACSQSEGWNWSFGEQGVARGGAPESGPVESNIVRVNKFFSQTPWLSFAGDGSNRVNGVRITVYLEGANEPKGVFGTGTLVVGMYRLDVDPATGRERSTLAYEWELPPERAYVWRAKEETALGWGYGLRLQWPDDLDVGGRQVAFVVKYLREDGRIISSSRQVLKVPFVGGVAAAGHRL